MARKKQSNPFGAFVTAGTILGVFIAMFWSRYFAAWLYGVESPSRHQIHMAEAIIAAPIAVPLSLFLLWLWWHQRRDDKALRRRNLLAPKLADPAHELKLDRARNDVN